MHSTTIPAYECDICHEKFSGFSECIEHEEECQYKEYRLPSHARCGILGGKVWIYTIDKTLYLERDGVLECAGAAIVGVPEEYSFLLGQYYDPEDSQWKKDDEIPF